MSLELGKEGLKNCWRKIMLPSDHHLKSHHSGQDRLEALLPADLDEFSFLFRVTRTDSEKKNLFFSYQESSGTHVLIPVPGGLVEMYSTKHVEEDESVLDYVKG
ncbi:uncharacterized protein [Spinacia oleracea]|uniref:Uncharacterized protein LOC110798715 isoform X1 n=1 Tax=Spinacia oleracea TaxID=3562 RepID=A0A9R0J301_SPIOL|nr:uncharacterized protein LOC110798715 isoform X1 [Spinacia oleracea]XP_056684435.1 uncharacterized protein LOC110798715 isoform X1 [Spinacia oleracea]XP_056684436.1 uncharacterized protein LOC110798715 isoform X1 [Spinacia oleracea]